MMSNALALGAVTAVLKNLLDNAVVNEKLTSAVGPVKVSTLSPDQLKKETFVGLSLFLYHVQPNSGWRNIGFPSRDGDGTRISNPPLALDLYYLLSAWGKEDFESEILLGYAMQLFHEMPVLSRETIRKTFEISVDSPVVKPDMLPAKYAGLAAAELAEQVEQLKIVPHSMASEETSKLWTATLASLRPSAAYQVSVVLIEAHAPTKDALPVLDRNFAGSPGLDLPFPSISAVVPPLNQPAVKLGQTLAVSGDHLDGITVRARLHNALAPSLPLIGPLTGSARSVNVPIPSSPSTWPAGVYMLSLTITRATEQRTTNELPVAVAPEINIGASSAVAGPNGVTATIQCSPDVQPHQNATLVLGQATATSEPHATATSTLTFKFPADIAPPPGTYFVRLRIDGVESLIIDRSTTPPHLDTTQRLTVT